VVVVGVLTAVTGAVLLGSAPSALAHDVLLSTVPAAGAHIATVPLQVRLVFDKPALGLGTAVTVTGPAGNVADGSPVLVDTTVTEHLRPGAPAGAYVVRWRVTSADGHPVAGSFTFTASAASSASASTVTGASPRTPPAGGSRIPLVSLLLAVVLAMLALVAVLAVRAVRRPKLHAGAAGQPEGGSGG
jgi:copper resistance protein C